MTTPAQRQGRLRGRRVVALLLGAVLVWPALSYAQADTAPPDTTTPVTVSADALPTAQMDGVAWTQVIVGNTVYVGGSFVNARPAGAALGQQSQPRANLLAYDLDTGVLKPFAPKFSAQVRALAVSKDGKTLYAGGDFTTVNNVARAHIAAFDLATGALRTDFAPTTNNKVLGLATTASKVYAAGDFTLVNGVARVGAAALDAKSGALLPFVVHPGSGAVNQVQVSPDEKKVVLGGAFTTMNGSSSPGRGLAMFDAVSSKMLPMPVGSIIQDGGPMSAITTLLGDATGFYGGGYVFKAGNGNLEGMFRSDWSGNLVWLEDCHGDTYSVAATKDVVYIAGHPHECSTIGGFPRGTPQRNYHGLAFATKASLTIGRNPYPGYESFTGRPAPALLHWFPKMAYGTYTGMNQAAWSVAVTSRYVVYGGEFPSVNGQAQQGLVRFETPTYAPKKVGPAFDTSTPLTAKVWSRSEVRISWPAGSDLDNEQLGYQLFRRSSSDPAGNGALIYEANARTKFWRQPNLSYLDSGLSPGTYAYRLRVFDPNGNELWVSASATVVDSSSPALSPYQKLVLADGPTSYWPMDALETDRTRDVVGGNDLKRVGPIKSLPAPAAIVNDPRPGVTLTPTTSPAGLRGASVAPVPTDYTQEAWFRTKSTKGGEIMGFEEDSTSYSDRNVYLTSNGQLRFEVMPSRVIKTIAGTTSYNDGKWHHVAATQSAAGLALYADGVKVGSLADVRSPRFLSTASFRVGDANLDGLANKPASSALTGDLDEVALYPVALTASQIGEHVQRGRGQQVLPRPFLQDSFNQVSAKGLRWPTVGGPWQVLDAARASSSDGKAVFSLPTPGSEQSISGGISRKSDVQTGFTTSRTASGSGTYVKVEGRRIDSQNAYWLTLRVDPSNKVTYYFEGVQNGTQVKFGTTKTLSGTFKPGTYVNARVETAGSTGTTLRAKVWFATSAEPSAWALTAQDSTPSLQAPGKVGVSAVTSKSASASAPMTVRVEWFLARPAA